MIALNETELKIIKNIFQKYLPKEKVMIFGSRATGKIKPYSDLDLCILNKYPLSLETISYLKEAFSESDLPFRVDIVEWAKISLEFKETIENDLIELQK
jgi:predicted nucleotidyltransferase